MRVIVVLVTSIVDPRRIFHSRLHELLRAFPEEQEVLVVWPGHTARATELPVSGGLSGAAGSPRGLVLDDILSSLALPSRLRGKDLSLVLNYNTFGTGLVASLIARRQKVPVVYDLADDLVPTVIHFLPRPFWGLARALASLVVSLNVRLADCLTCTTEALAAAHGSGAGRCVLLPNGVETERFGLRDSERGRAFDTIRLVYVGTLRAWLDFAPVFQAVQILMDQGLRCEVLIVGEGPDQARLRASAEDMGVASVVRFAGPVPYEQVPAILGAADICLLPFDTSPISRGAFPLKLLEYMAARRPIISSPLPAARQVAGDLIWYAQSSADYVRAIREIVERGVAPDRLEAAAEVVRERYSWDMVRNELIAVVASLTRGRGGGAVGR